MPNVIETGIQHCKECCKATKQHRNLKKSSVLGLCMHVCAIVMTWGLWLIPLGIYKLNANSTTRWICKDCGTKN